MPAPDFQSQLVSDHSVEPIKALAHVGRSKSDIDPDRRPKPKHNLRSPQRFGSRRAKVSASKSRLTSIRRPPANTTQRASSRSAAVALQPSHLHLNQSLTFVLPVDFHPAPFEPTLQCAQRQSMFVTKFAPPQSTGFEFCHQSFDLLAASPLPTLTPSLSVIPTAHQKRARSTRWVRLTDTKRFLSHFYRSE
jgi:hypothetical protein